MKELTKKELELAGIEASEFLVESGEDVLPRYIEISRQIVLLEAEKKGLKEAAFDERTLHGTDLLTLEGCKLSISNTGDRIQYDKDPVIAELKNCIKDREVDVKIAVNQSRALASELLEIARSKLQLGADLAADDWWKRNPKWKRVFRDRHPYKDGIFLPQMMKCYDENSNI